MVLVTAPNLKVARKLARVICETRFAACVNLLPGIESHYWWEGKIESGREVLLLIKARKRSLDRLEEVILREHPYDTPEIVAIPPSHGTARYLSWWADAAKAAP